MGVKAYKLGTRITRMVRISADLVRAPTEGYAHLGTPRCAWRVFCPKAREKINAPRTAWRSRTCENEIRVNPPKSEWSASQAFRVPACAIGSRAGIEPLENRPRSSIDSRNSSQQSKSAPISSNPHSGSTLRYVASAARSESVKPIAFRLLSVSKCRGVVKS